MAAPATAAPERDARPGRITPAISLRRAARSDYAFAAALYQEGTRKLLVALQRWNQRRVMARFKHAFRPEQAVVIRAYGHDIGWMQVSATGRGYHVQQLHLLARFRNRGIGGRLLRQLMRRAAAQRRPVALNVIRGNPAVGLYQRLGFQTLGATDEKLHMRWEASRGGGTAHRSDPRG